MIHDNREKLEAIPINMISNTRISINSSPLVFVRIASFPRRRSMTLIEVVSRSEVVITVLEIYTVLESAPLIIRKTGLF